MTYGSVAIGTAAGGAAGADLTITFNAAATSVAVDALIQNLTYANSSDVPTASRQLLLNVRDAAKTDFGAVPGVDASFAALTGAANPFNGIDVGYRSTPTFVDLDGDGDLDLVVGETDGALFSFANNGAGAFTPLTGTANPFNGLGLAYNSAPTFVDLDSDGDLDLVAGDWDGVLVAYENKTPRGIGVTVAILPEQEAPTIAGDETITVEEGGSVVLTVADFVGTDIDDDDATLAYVVSALVAGTVQVAGAAVTTFTATQLAAGDVSFVHDGSEDAGAFDVAAVDDEAASSAAITVTATVTPVNDAPTLTGLDDVTFTENTVNSAPQLLGIDVSFADAEGNFDGGTLSLKGLLAEDSVSVRNQGTGAGEIGFDGTTVTYGNVAIGTATGGAAGADLAITFNAAATSDAVDALIQNLTYANSSDAPTTSRELVLNVTDAAGSEVAVSTAAGFTELTGTDNPFNGISLGYWSAPSFVDLDGDGDLDLVAGQFYGGLLSFANDGAGGYAALTGTANPFNGIYTGILSAPTFVDLDKDGDLDLVVGANDGTLLSFANDGAGGFAALTGTANPFDGIGVGKNSSPTFVDLDGDGDGDLDLVIGESSGTLLSFANDGAGVFTPLAGTANPFDGIDMNRPSTPGFVDLDGDGDLDLVVGDNYGALLSFANDGAGGFSALTGVADPFNGIDVGYYYNALNFVDLDEDGDLDLVVGLNGTLATYENTTPKGVDFTVAITPENDAPTGTGLPVTLAANEDETFDVDLSALQLNDPDGATDFISLTIQASAGRVDLSAGVGVLVLQTGTSIARVQSSAAALEAYLQGTGVVRFTGAQDAFGDGIATLSVVGDDGVAQTSFGTINVDLADVVDTRTGGSGEDTLLGDAGLDILIGNAGDDTLIGGAGADTLSGGAGTDEINGDAGDDVIYVASATSRGFGNDSVSGGEGHDWIMGSNGANFLSGDDGNDTIDGGDDWTSADTDTLNGGDGDDLLTSGQFRAPVAGFEGFGDILNGGAGADTLIGGLAQDTLSGGHGTDDISGGDGDDVIYTASATSRGFGRDSVSGGEGHDWIMGSNGANLLSGDAGNDTLNGGDDWTTADTDTLNGGDGDDLLISGQLVAPSSGFEAFGDILNGGIGADTLNGGLAQDTLTGGAGADVFLFNVAIGTSNVDRIVDLTVSDGDGLELDDAVFAGLAVGALQETEFRANLAGIAEAAGDRIIYNTSTGQLYFDADGLGGVGAIEFAVLDNTEALDWTDISVI